MRADWILDGDEPLESARHREATRRIIATYPPVVRAYCRARFQILHVRFLEEIAQYLPASGTVLDLGCGFGLFALYMAIARPDVSLTGIDLSSARIEQARSSARALGLTNVRFETGDLRTWRPQAPTDTVYMLDVLHHVPIEAGDALIRGVHAVLRPGGRLLLKEVDTHPRAKALFTYALDRLMAPRDPICYRSASAWRALLGASGFHTVACHTMWDVLPYPHVLLVADR